MYIWIKLLNINIFIKHPKANLIILYQDIFPKTQYDYVPLYPHILNVKKQ